MGRNVGGHSHRNSGRAIEKKLRNPGGQHRRFLLRPVEVVGEVNSFGLDVFEKAVGGESLESRFGVPHRRRWVIVHRPEIAVAINQRHRHREILGHPDQGVVDGCVAMGVVLTEHLTDHTRALSVRPIAGETELVHRVKDAAMHGLQTVPRIGQSPPDNHAHRVLQVGARHLVAEIRLNDPIVGLSRTAVTRPHWIRHTRPKSRQGILYRARPCHQVLQSSPIPPAVQSVPVDGP